jgi:hypothetical protein
LLEHARKKNKERRRKEKEEGKEKEEEERLVREGGRERKGKKIKG